MTRACGTRASLGLGYALTSPRMRGAIREGRGSHEVDRPRRFVFDWDAGSGQQVMVRSTIEVEDGVVLRLREDGYDRTAAATEARVRQACGWGEAMTLIKFMAEHGLRYQGRRPPARRGTAS